MSNLLTKTKQGNDVEISRSSKLSLLVGEEVFNLLSDPAFQSGWDVLYNTCPWGTVFQSREFVATWYHIYKSKYLPVVVKSEEQGRLTGLLTMALPLTSLNESSTKKAKGRIVGAGASQAEYQVWLTPVPDNGHFIKNALHEIKDRFPGFNVQLKYIPGQANIEWAGSDTFWRKRCVVRKVRQPLMVIDEERLTNELRKKNRREKINRLKRLGELKFEHITDGAVFLSIIDELALQYDFRKEAMFNAGFFSTDPLRKTFLVALFDQNVLHATVLKLNNEIIASNVSATGKKWVHLQGINTHLPTYAKFSPGILHFLMLGKALYVEGMEIFDLTPGADAYKDLLATDYACACQLDVGSVYEKQKRVIKLKLTNYTKKGASRIGLSAKDLKRLKRKYLFLKEKVKNFKHQQLSTLLQSVTSRRSTDKKITLLSNNNLLGSTSIEVKDIKFCDLGDLLNFEDTRYRRTRWEFLEEAMGRFECGERAYTLCEGGRLLACAWLSPPRAAATELEGESAQLQGLYCHPNGQERFRAFLGYVAAQVARQTGVSQIYAVANSHDRVICRLLEGIDTELQEK